MKITLAELTVLIDAAYAAARAPILRQYGLKYDKEVIIDVINSVQDRMRAVEVEVET